MSAVCMAAGHSGGDMEGVFAVCMAAGHSGGDVEGVCQCSGGTEPVFRAVFRGK